MSTRQAPANMTKRTNSAQQGASTMKQSRMLTFAVILSVFFAASASAQTVSAHGSGVIVGAACDRGGVCPDFGGRGVKFSFNFSGTGMGPIVPVTGTWSASEQDTGVQVQFLTGTAFVIRQFHQIVVFGTCSVTTPTSTTQLGPCFFSAQDRTPNGAVDLAQVVASAPNGFISTAPNELASGNNNIQ
jgi:hypothetical protein